jgi:hypothetical protein
MRRAELLGGDHAVIMRRALLVGINDYPSAPLARCVDEAKAMQRRLHRNDDGRVNFRHTACAHIYAAATCWLSCPCVVVGTEAPVAGR